MADPRPRGRPRAAPTRSISTRITPATYDALYRLSRARETTMCALTRDVLRRALRVPHGPLSDDAEGDG